MKTIRYVAIKIIGVILVVLGGIFAISALAGLIGIITVSITPETQGIEGLLFAFVACSAIAFFLIRGGRRLILRGKSIQFEVQAEKADRLAKENELRELEHQRQIDAKREEARIQQQKFDIVQLELQNRLAEQERLRVIEIEAEKQRAREAEIRQENQFVFLTDEQIAKLEQRIELPNLDDCELILQHGEIAIYGSHATWYANKEPLHGHIYITNYRIGFVSAEKGFLIDHNDVVAIGSKTNGLIIQMKQGSYSLDLPRADLAYMVLKGLRAALPIANIEGGNALSNSIEDDIIKDISAIDGMEGHDFEYFCAELLEKNGFTGVEVTKGSGDQGVDILATKGGVKYAIQCKNYATRLGNTPIQEVNAGKTYYNCHVGVVMTNSTFTSAAEELATSTNVLLWDRKVLEQYMKNGRFNK